MCSVLMNGTRAMERKEKNKGESRLMRNDGEDKQEEERGEIIDFVGIVQCIGTISYTGEGNVALSAAPNSFH